MTLPVIVEKCDGQFAAVLLGDSNVRIVRPSPREAVAGLQAEILRRMEAGELVSVEVHPQSITDLAGKYADDPTLRQICESVYRERDAAGAE